MRSERSRDGGRHDGSPRPRRSGAPATLLPWGRGHRGQGSWRKSDPGERATSARADARGARAGRWSAMQGRNVTEGWHRFHGAPLSGYMAHREGSIGTSVARVAAIVFPDVQGRLSFPGHSFSALSAGHWHQSGEPRPDATTIYGVGHQASLATCGAALSLLSMPRETEM